MSEMKYQLDKLEKDQAQNLKIIEGLNFRLNQFEVELWEGKKELSRHVQYEVVGAASWEMRKTRDAMKTYFEKGLDKILQFFKDRDASKNVDLPKGDHSSRNATETNNHQSNSSKVEIPEDRRDYNHQKSYRAAMQSMGRVLDETQIGISQIRWWDESKCHMDQKRGGILLHSQSFLWRWKG